ncbi:histidine phosphatase family protein [Desulfuromonas acetoxidans]|uniref:Phosphohistidine phosphatase, SixA n=1 Tax=Desulfuromonas acetoxidans (strain DSM 684 / 11070) TaxID=281689 RepID=Q1K2B7_DESA6|nr:histidine phosphatase family protein [Desulfuromonas acetoxidans]EAT16522.1 putative phosphohistidine phosphatase, SixA [Desulfuromonas acetoxidans DSM 684]MBF0646760.1 histidine phosphatase family protein [Desulfuromonas acetoxidans]NVD26130.1 histidine phosphatase family protein [Desulfuromonas acetoxidans]NVE17971.1 histidine phosphatase family protein [Desulfuromonas acetoxidans]
MSNRTKKLTLIRHAKSSWDDDELDDKQRPLTRRGEKDAACIGKWLKDQHWRPDGLWSSNALRALMTSKIIASTAKLSLSSLEKKKKLYLAEADNLMSLITNLDDRIDHIALVGHNPGLLDFVNALTGEMIETLPTCAVYIIEFPCRTWQEVTTGFGTTQAKITPKKLR